MKKTLIALAALGAMAGAAQAQSTVTIYGLLDANIGSYKTNQINGAAISGISQAKIDSGGLNGSRWGIRFSEDIGGGMAVIGNLESGINLDAGSSAQGGLLFGRRANVGIASGFGTVTIGRNSSSYDDVSADHAMMGATLFDPSNTNNGFSTATAGAIGTLAGNAALLNHGGNGSGAHVTWVGFNTRFNNSIKYVSPNFGGFTGSFMYAFGEDKTAAVSASNTVSANLKYANGPLVISGGYQSEGAARTATTKPALTNTLLNVAYDFGVAKVGFGANRAKFKDVITTFGANGVPTAAHELGAQKEYSLSVAVPLGATTLSAGYARSKGDDLGSSTGWGLQALYSLSKRTTLYTGAVSTKNYSNVASNTMIIAPTSSITRTTTYAAGIRHTF
jgi:predicted porin